MESKWTKIDKIDLYKQCRLIEEKIVLARIPVSIFFPFLKLYTYITRDLWRGKMKNKVEIKGTRIDKID